MKSKGITKYILSVFIGVVIVCCFYSSGLALTNEEVFSQFQFNFITPGARAPAMGSAFIGLADDATAVESNPAGLTQLLDPEVSAEFKYITYTAEQMYENHSHETDITRKEFDDSVTSVPFVSIVYPYKRFVFSVYRQELVNYKSAYRTGAQDIYSPGVEEWVFYPVDASVDLTVTNYGIGAAVQILESLSLAVSPRWSQMKMKSHSARFESDTNFSEVRHESIIDDDDDGFSINVGVMWIPHPQVSIGTVYRSGPEFTVTEECSERGVACPGVFNNPESINFSDVAEFTVKVPDSFGAGIAFRVTDVLTCTLDVVHLQYKDLLEDFDLIYYGDEYKKNNYTIDNATEIHAGIEYILLLGERLLALRAGIYHEPDHTIRFTGTTGDAEDDAGERTRFPGGEDQIHVTGGLGLVLNDHFQIDTAANISENNTQFSISAVYRF